MHLHIVKKLKNSTNGSFSKTNAMLKAMVKGTNNVNIRIIKYKIDNKSLPYRFRRVYNSTIKT